ncbi:hypothetical protein AAC387_Pa08g1005 [Persea americana]
MLVSLPLNTQKLKVSLTQARIDMSELDENFDGFLQSQEMEAYISGLIPNLAQLRDMPAAFIQMYCRIAAHKFFFFCDPHRRGKACIKKVLLSNCLEELMELYQVQKKLQMRIKAQGKYLQAILEKAQKSLSSDDSRVLSGKTSSSRVHDDDYMIWYGLDTDKSIGCEDAEKERSDDEYLFSPKGAASKA